MKQAMKLYALIKKDQLILAFILGVVLMGLEVGTSLWQNKVSDIVNSGLLLIGGWLLVGFVSLLMDQSRRLDIWLYTQKISRGQLFIIRVLLMVVVPIVTGLAVNTLILLAIQPADLRNLMLTSANLALGYFFIASLTAVIYTIIGPNWMKVAGLFFTLAVLVQPLETIASLWHNDLLPDMFVTLLTSMVLLSIGYSLSKKISAETTDEAVRVRYLRWPVVIFVFVATDLTSLANHVGQVDIKVVVSTMIVPIILSGLTFFFVFRPKIKLTWDK